MRAAGVELIDDSTKYAAVGAFEAFAQLGKYTKLYRELISAIRTAKPDLAVLIDFPDFNLRFAHRLKDAGVPIVYYISPQVWAWRPNRVYEIARLVRKMLVIFPFEKEIYDKAGVDCEFIGHPLMDIFTNISEFDGLRKELGIGKNELVIGLLPGSREKEVTRIFPVMLDALDIISVKLPQTKFLVAVAPDLEIGLFRKLVKKRSLSLFKSRTYEVMYASDLLLIASGTATVEAAILEKPMIVTYKVNPLTAILGYLLIRSKNLAMVNIIAGKRIMPEYYQWYARPSLISSEAISIIGNGRLGKMKEELSAVKSHLGTPGASSRAANSILKLL